MFMPLLWVLFMFVIKLILLVNALHCIVSTEGGTLVFDHV